MADIERIKERVAKLLAVVANEASTDGEKANAMEMANNIMREYNLEREDIEDGKVKEDFNKVHVNTVFTRMMPWESTLSVFVMDKIMKGVFCYTSSIGKQRGITGSVGQAIVVFVGNGPDAEMAAETYKHLRQILLSNCQSKYGTPVRGSGRDYSVGFVNGLFKAAKQAEELEAGNQEVSRALIRTDMLKASAQNWMTTEHGMNFVSRSNRTNLNDRDAYDRGVQDGLNADRSKRHVISGHLN